MSWKSFMTLRIPLIFRHIEASSVLPRYPDSVVIAGLPRRIAVLPKYLASASSLERVSSMIIGLMPKASAIRRVVSSIIFFPVVIQ